MKAMILAYETPADFEKRRGKSEFDAYMAPWRAYAESLKKAGALLDGAALEGPETATTVSARNGRRAIEDGPFIDGKEQLGGYFLIDVANLDDAIAVAARIPGARRGTAEIRPLLEVEGLPE